MFVQRNSFGPAARQFNSLLKMLRCLIPFRTVLHLELNKATVVIYPAGKVRYANVDEPVFGIRVI